MRATYERSCQQYVAVHQQLVPPDTFRLRYRNELAATIPAIVRGGHRGDEAAIRAVLPPTVAVEDKARFVALSLAEFKTIHPGNAIGFGIRPLEFFCLAGTGSGTYLIVRCQAQG